MRKADDSKRKEIMAAASRLFDVKPYHEVRIEDVAADAHVSKGTVYTYFDSKEHLYLCILTEGAAEVVSELERIAESGEEGPAERLMLMVDAIVNFALDFPEAYRLQHAGAINVSRGELMDLARRGQGAMGRVVGEGISSGVFEEVDPALTFFLITGFVGEVIKLDERQHTQSALTEHVRSTVLRGILKHRGAE